MAECCILINFSPFQDHSYYYKNTDNTKHMLEIHSQLQPRRPGDVLSHMSSGMVRNQQAPSPVPSETPTPFSVGLLSLRHQPSPEPRPSQLLSSQRSSTLPAPSLQKLRGGEVSGLQKSWFNYFIVQRKGTFSHLGRMLRYLPLQSVKRLPGLQAVLSYYVRRSGACAGPFPSPPTPPLPCWFGGA